MSVFQSFYPKHWNLFCKRWDCRNLNPYLHCTISFITSWLTRQYFILARESWYQLTEPIWMKGWSVAMTRGRRASTRDQRHSRHFLRLQYHTQYAQRNSWSWKIGENWQKNYKWAAESTRTKSREFKLDICEHRMQMGFLKFALLISSMIWPRDRIEFS